MVMSAGPATATGWHIVAGRGHVGGRRVTGPARRAVTWLEAPLPRGARPSPPGPAIWGAAAPDLLRPFLPVVSEMTGPAPAVPGRPDPARAGSWLAGVAAPAARELAAVPMRSAWPHPPAARGAAGRQHAP